MSDQDFKTRLVFDDLDAALAHEPGRTIKSLNGGRANTTKRQHGKGASTTENEKPPAEAEEHFATALIPHVGTVEAASLDGVEAEDFDAGSFGGLTSKDGSFQLSHLIGKGGQGEVWEALQVELGRVVAVKRSRVTGNAQLDFIKEAYTSAQLDHPNIVPVYDIGLVTADGRRVPFLAMKRVVGRSWQAALAHDREEKHLSHDDFLARHLQILIPVINAVAYAHNKRIIHRDLKPGQVMLGEYGEVFLLDWGLAILLDEVQPPAAPEHQTPPNKFYTLDTATNPAGTPVYMAPEQATADTVGLGIHTDVYLLGAILFEIVVGKPPHSADTVRKAMMKAQMNECLPYPDDAPEELTALIDRCLATDPADRPKRVLEIRRGIEDYLSGASKKDLSRRQTAKIMATNDLGDYEHLSVAAKELSQAAVHWPDNPDILPCREKLLTHFVDVALINRDFLIAELQADRVERVELAEDLRRRIAAAREQAIRDIPPIPLFNRTRTALFVGVYLLIIVAVFAIERAANKIIAREVHDKAMSVAALAAGTIRPDDLRAVDETRDIYTPAFQRILNQLGFFRKSNDDIRYIYVFKREPGLGEGVWRVLVDADPVDLDLNGDGTISNDEKGQLPGELYTEGTLEMQAAMDTMTPTSGNVQDDWGDFVSGFAPVIDPRSRNPVALVGIDIKAETVTARLNRVFRFTLAGAAVILALLTAALLAFFQSRRTLEQIRYLQEERRKRNSEGRGKKIYLG